MVDYKEGNLFQKMAINRIFYVLALVVFQLILAVNRLPHPGTTFFLVSAQVLLLSGISQYSVANKYQGEFPECLSQNLWCVGEMIRNATQSFRPSTQKSVFMKALCGLAWSVVGIVSIAFGVLQLPLILIELGWGMMKRKTLKLSES